MSDVFHLPERIPESWQDLTKWVRTREGYRERLRDALGESELRAVIDEIVAERVAHPIKPETVAERLDEYFAGERDLDLRDVAKLIRAAGVWPRVGKVAPFDLFRAAWMDGTLDDELHLRNPRSLYLEQFGFRFWRMQSATCDRALNATVRRWESRDGKGTSHAHDGLEASDYHVSLGAGVMAVLKGSVEIRVLGPKGHPPLVVHAGELAAYRMNWPHKVVPLTEDATTIEVCVSKRGIPTEYFLGEYSSPLVGEFPQPEDERPGYDGARHLLSHAIASSGMSQTKLARLLSFCGGTHLSKRSGDALRELLRGETKLLELSHVREVAHALRIPEGHFFAPLSKHLEEVTNGPFNLVGDEPSPRMHEVGSYVREWKLCHPPTGILGRESLLEVNVVECIGPPTEESAWVERRDDLRGERLIVVIRGSLGVKLHRGGTRDSFCRGVLGVGDALWFRPELIPHGLWAERSDEPTRFLDLRFPYAEGQKLAWGRLRGS